ncbi:hypothetical protein GQX73_g6211 [Xylaria multiplex]|uniref:Protein kinase domain-containing protein n=1 Tax=Xylaria multiplex TaxID=323545 RepID=A0A7C8MT67_9PEZI|nr:hypothetical protein GQX73_g6211 [Xylaria multiplex]
MDRTSTTAVTENTMGAKLLGVKPNDFRPMKIGRHSESIERVGFSKPTKCLFLADDGSLKWVAVNAGVFRGYWSWGDTSKLVFPPFPTGSWTVGQIHRAESGEVCFKQTAEMPVEGIDQAWHPTKIDFTEFELVGQVGGGYDGRVWRAKHPHFNGVSILVKIDPWSTGWSKQAIENETKAYQWIDGHGIAPKFLGHVTYHGKIIGFITEWLEGTETVKRKDKSARLDVVKKLHSIGITHGSPHYLNFLKKGENMLMVDFEEARFGEQATDKHKQRDIECICDYPGMCRLEHPGEYEDELEHELALSSSRFFDWMMDDDINWTDDSEADEDDGSEDRMIDDFNWTDSESDEDDNSEEGETDGSRAGESNENKTE